MPPPTDPPTDPRTGWVEVRPSPISGRGVFATRPIPAGTVVHVAPVVLLDDESHDLIDETELSGYVYDWHGGGVALALGYGSLFNHASSPSCRHQLVDDDHPAAPAIEYVTVRTVAADEELTIGYVDDDESLWFDPAG